MYLQRHRKWMANGPIGLSDYTGHKKRRASANKWGATELFNDLNFADFRHDGCEQSDVG